MPQLHRAVASSNTPRSRTEPSACAGVDSAVRVGLGRARSCSRSTSKARRKLRLVLGLVAHEADSAVLDRAGATAFERTEPGIPFAHRGVGRHLPPPGSRSDTASARAARGRGQALLAKLEEVMHSGVPSASRSASRTKRVLCRTRLASKASIPRRGAGGSPTSAAGGPS